MIKLEYNWFADGIIDFEYKKYLLLAYLKSVGKNFISNKLYPDLGDLVKHYNNLAEFLKNKNAASESFPKELKSLDFENFILNYQRTLQDDRLMDDILKIVDFSMPAFKKYLEEGREIYDWIESRMLLRQVGIVSLQQQYGYMLIRNGDENESKVYTYSLTIFQSPEENYRGITTNYITSLSSINYHNVQTTIMKHHQLLVPPAVFAIESELHFPVDETLLPIAKRTLVRYLSAHE